MTQNVDLKNDLLDASQLAEALGVSVRTIRSWTAKGKISVIRISERCHRYHKATVLADLKKHETSSPVRKKRKAKPKKVEADYVGGDLFEGGKHA